MNNQSKASSTDSLHVENMEVATGMLECTPAPPPPAQQGMFFLPFLTWIKENYNTPSPPGSCLPANAGPDHIYAVTPPAGRSQLTQQSSAAKTWDFTGPSFDLRIEDDGFDTPLAAKNQDAATPSPPRKTRRQVGLRCPLVAGNTFMSARRAIDEINLNAAAPEQDYTSSPVTKVVASIGKFAQSPWELGHAGSLRDPNQAEKFYQWACASNPAAIRYSFIHFLSYSLSNAGGYIPGSDV